METYPSIAGIASSTMLEETVQCSVFFFSFNGFSATTGLYKRHDSLQARGCQDRYYNDILRDLPKEWCERLRPYDLLKQISQVRGFTILVGVTEFLSWSVLVVILF